jgi:hypothetical protein
MTTKRELKAQVAELRAQVEALRAQVVAGIPVVSSQCTCYQTGICPVHRVSTGNVWIWQPNQWANACAGIGTTLTVPVSRESMTFTRDLVAPGCAGNPAATMTYFTVDAN